MPSTCRNCGDPAALDYCPSCGQAVDEGRAPLTTLLGDFLSEFLSLDGRHLRTARELLRPGRLTVRYLQGKRASYVSPVRVYFVASLLFFLLVGFPAPDAREQNVYVDGVLIDREEPDPTRGALSLSFGQASWLSRPFEPYLEARKEKLMALPAQELLDRFFASLERTLPTALIFYVPILALALKLVHLRSPFYYVDHLVFSLHYQSLLFLILIAAQLANRLGLGHLVPGLVTHVVTFLVAGPAVLLLALKRVYRPSWPWALLKTAAVGALYLVLIRPIILATFLLVLYQV